MQPSPCRCCHSEACSTHARNHDWPWFSSQRPCRHILRQPIGHQYDQRSCTHWVLSSHWYSALCDPRLEGIRRNCNGIHFRGHQFFRWPNQTPWMGVTRPTCPPRYGALLTCVYSVLVCFVEDLYLCEVYYLFLGGNSILFLDFLSEDLPAIASMLTTHFVPTILHKVIFLWHIKVRPSCCIVMEPCTIDVSDWTKIGFAKGRVLAVLRTTDRCTAPPGRA